MSKATEEPSMWLFFIILGFYINDADILDLLGQSFGAALLIGTFVFYMLKGFILSNLRWIHVICWCLVPCGLMIFLSYPTVVHEQYWLIILMRLLFFGGMAGAIKYYWKRKKSSINEESIPK